MNLPTNNANKAKGEGLPLAPGESRHKGWVIGSGRVGTRGAYQGYAERRSELRPTPRKRMITARFEGTGAKARALAAIVKRIDQLPPE